MPLASCLISQLFSLLCLPTSSPVIRARLESLFLPLLFIRNLSFCLLQLSLNHIALAHLPPHLSHQATNIRNFVRKFKRPSEAKNRPLNCMITTLVPKRVYTTEAFFPSPGRVHIARAWADIQRRGSIFAWIVICLFMAQTQLQKSSS